MISLPCTRCKIVLTIDDAFAGGVCRCQHCGTIQTVPAHLRTGVPQTVGVETGPKSLYQHKRNGSVGSGTGLDELADVVASSGLAGSGLSSLSSHHHGPGNAPANGNRTAIIASAAIGAAALVGMVLWFALSSKDRGTIPPVPQPNPVVNNTNPDTPTPPPTPAGPCFADIPLAGNSVVYVLDRGTSMRECFSDIKDRCVASVGTLGLKCKFLVIFWDVGEGNATFPADGSPAPATPQNVQALKKMLEDVNAFRQSEFKTAIQKALAVKPDHIILATAKGFQLDESFVNEIEALRNHQAVRIHTVSLSGESKALQSVAKNTGGQYRELH